MACLGRDIEKNIHEIGRHSPAQKISTQIQSSFLPIRTNADLQEKKRQIFLSVYLEECNIDQATLIFFTSHTIFGRPNSQIDQSCLLAFGTVDQSHYIIVKCLDGWYESHLVGISMYFFSFPIILATWLIRWSIFRDATNLLTTYYTTKKIQFSFHVLDCNSCAHFTVTILFDISDTWNMQNHCIWNVGGSKSQTFLLNFPESLCPLPPIHHRLDPVVAQSSLVS